MSMRRKILRNSFKKKFNARKYIACKMAYRGIKRTTHDANEESELVHFQHGFGVARETNNSCSISQFS